MRSIGKLLQLLGLIMLPAAMILQFTPANTPTGTALSVGQLLMALIAGACLFWIGRIMEGYSK